MESNSIQSNLSDKFVPNQVKCRICRKELKQGATIFQEGFSLGVVCEQCYKHNSPEDLELIANLFMAYGGYFGQYKDENYSLYDSLQKFLKKKESKDIKRLNIRLMHEALLHGKTPHQYFQSLRILAE